AEGARARTGISSVGRRWSPGSHASRLWRARSPLSRRSRGLGKRMQSRSRSVSVRKELLEVAGVERLGPYSLVRLKRGALESGVPGQFFMLSPPGRLLPRPMSLCLATRHELGFLIDPIGPGTVALAELARNDWISVLGPLGNGFRLDIARPLLV